MQSPRKGVIERYRPLLKIAQEAQAVTLLEGDTPLIAAPKIADWIGIDAEIYLKYEGLNPTGSFKDRGMTTAITQAAFDGAQAVICASTGNTAASAAAYAARAGLRCIVIVPEGKIAKGKLAGALAYGAEVVQITGNFDQGLDMVREAGETLPVMIVNSINDYRLEGQKTAAFEIVDALGDAPDWLCLPVGNAGNITAYWMGFTQYQQAGKATGVPRLLGAQAAGAAPLVRGEKVEHPETVASAIRIGNPARWQQAMMALDESDGQILAVSDAVILESWRMLSTLEGVFVEPASAAGVAGLKRLVDRGWKDMDGKRIVCVLTGHGLKDPEIVFEQAASMDTISPHIDDLRAIIERPTRVHT